MEIRKVLKELGRGNRTLDVTVRGYLLDDLSHPFRLNISSLTGDRGKRYGVGCV